MPRQAGSSFQNSFIGGFVTQATALDFPENAAFDQDNVVFSEIGIAQRRPGLEFENNATFLTADRTQKAQTTFLWKNVAGDGNTNLVVQQNGDTLYFYKTGQALSLSAGLSANSVGLTSFIAAGATSDNINQNECQYSSGLGYLFVVHPYCDPFYIKYNSDGTFTSSIINFTIRDVFGLVESGNVDDRPGSLSDTHKYNLYNQGWDSTKYTTFFTAASSKYPSNADVWWIYKDSTDVFNPGTTLANNSRGSTSAPRGYFRLSPWNTNRAAIALAQAGLTVSLTGDETSGTIRPAVTEFHAGRVWYSGVNAQGYNTRIYVSKIVEQTSDFGFCAAVNDPTNETLFDFVSSDGLIINIPQAGTIYRLVSIGTTMLVFGANGVWAITGSQGVGFSATDYSVNPIGYTRSISGSSFVLVDNNVVWWNFTGIHMVSNSDKGLTIQSLSDDKIKDYYLSIDNTAKKYAKGAYNPRTHVIQWLFTDDAPADVTSTFTFNKSLCFNTLIKAFYTWSLPTSTVAVNSILVLEGAGSVTGSDNIVDNGANLVVDNLGNQVVTFGFSQTTITTVTKYLCSYANAGSYKITFAEAFNPNYFDWVQRDTVGVDYDSFFITGYSVKSQGMRRFQSNYIFIFSDLEVENNSYDFQALWNYANSGNSGDWSQRQRVLHTDTYRDAGRKRLKVRGSGEAVQFKFSSVSGKPFNIVGWSTYDTSNANP